MPNPPPTHFIDPSVRAGKNFQVWHYSVVLANCLIGDDVSIASHVEVGRGCHIGDRTRIGKGVFLPSGSIIGDDVFIGPDTLFCDDRYPKVNNLGYIAEPPRVGNDASIGAGCVILPGVTIGRGAMIGAGSVVTTSVPEYTHVRGEPARTRTLSQASREHFTTVTTSESVSQIPA